MFIEFIQPSPEAKILDVGATESEYQKSDNILEKEYPYPENITVLGVDNYEEFCKRYPYVKTIIYQGGKFPFKDKEFEICWCNAVIEHVGDRKAQEFFLKEISRTTKRAFITTPNKNFIYESHTRLLFLHYLPKKIFDKILVMIGKSWGTADYMNLLGEKDIINILEKSGITKYNIIKLKILSFTIGFVM